MTLDVLTIIYIIYEIYDILYMLYVLLNILCVLYLIQNIYDVMYNVLYIIYIIYFKFIVVGMMKMRNIVPRVGLEPTSLAFRASMLPLHHIGSLISSLYPHPPVYATPCLRGSCRLLLSSSWNCKSFNAYNYVHTGNGLR